MTAPALSERLAMAVKRPEFLVPVAVEVAALVVFVVLAPYRDVGSAWGRVACQLTMLTAMVCSILLMARRQLAPVRGYDRTSRGDS